MSLMPIAVPDVPVLWHNSVADVEPTSQYGLDRDLGSVNSTLCYLNPDDAPLELVLLAPSEHETESNIRRQSLEKALHQEAVALDRRLYEPAIEALRAAGQSPAALEQVLGRSPKHYVGRVVLERGAQVVRFHTRAPARAVGNGVYEFRLATPMGAGALGRGAALSALLLLPADAPDYQVEVVEWSAEDDPRAEVVVYGSQSRPKLAGRAAVAWRWVCGPFVWARYRYRR
jgi:hypothetical protein